MSSTADFDAFRARIDHVVEQALRLLEPGSSGYRCCEEFFYRGTESLLEAYNNSARHLNYFTDGDPREPEIYKCLAPEFRKFAHLFPFAPVGGPLLPDCPLPDDPVVDTTNDVTQREESIYQLFDRKVDPRTSKVVDLHVAEWCWVRTDNGSTSPVSCRGGSSHSIRRWLGFTF